MQFSQSYTENHQLLFDICLGDRKPLPQDVIPVGDYLSSAGLESLAYMAELEFAVSLERETRQSEGSAWNKGDTKKKNQRPNAFDVYLIQLDTAIKMGTGKLAVCMPMKGGVMMWYNGKEIWPLEPRTHLRKVSSLSGSARVLQGLKDVSYAPLGAMFLQRAELFIAEENFEEVLLDRGVPPSITKDMNDSQKQAVASAVSPRFTSGFFNVQGPPGTGKTTTMIGMISAIGSGILVCAPSNAAVANIALKLHTSGRFDLSEMCVYGDGCDESVQFLNPHLRSKAFKRFQSKLSGEEKEEERIKMWSHFANWLHLTDYEDAHMQFVFNCSPDINLSTINGRSKYERMLGSAKVLFCTLNTAGSRFLQNAMRGRFRTLMLDEGGQCPEAEFCIGVSVPGVERIIVVGDPKQLPATVIDKVCESSGYGKSWLGQIQKLFPRSVHLLDVQYRMDPGILSFPNKQFYDNRIISGDNVKTRTPFVKDPFLFFDTQKKGREEKEGFSWKNCYESKVITAIIKRDKDIERIIQENAAVRVIIITPYKAQAEVIKESVESLDLPAWCVVEVSTVDAFQGQEGDIVILATVRTRGVGFTDNPQRLNVALTRAKRVLRIVGDLSFFNTLPDDSTLKAIVQHSVASEKVVKSKIKREVWCPPDWDTPMKWKPVMTQRFHSCLQKMQQKDKFICLNTLIAVAIPDLCSLSTKLRESSSPRWYTSSLSSHESISIVWVAKERNCEAIVEVHFAGSEADCRRFRQVHHELPDGSRSAKPDLSGLDDAYSAKAPSGRYEPRWRMTNSIQNAITKSSVPALPQGNLELDPEQERIVHAPSPRMIESRGGTGKTLVLLQHLAVHTQCDDDRPACFVTVSPLLRKVLEQKFEEIKLVEHQELRPAMFFDFGGLLWDLIEQRNVLGFSSQQRCTFVGYVESREWNDQIKAEPHLVENEIGGVIMGSLLSAEQQKPLTREQYLVENRSNVGNRKDADHHTRNLIYDEFEKYRDWKRRKGKFDLGDVVLRLLNEEFGQPFASAYIDEVQDLSYAAIFLLCSLAGRDTLSWVFAGDPAQMISPGCSFTFDGLKNTLFSLRADIDINAKLKNVSRLLVNYRTTKDILALASSVLKKAHRIYPDAIGYCPPEVSKKDLGLNVVFCDWRSAMSTNVALGDNQALIYSSDDPRNPPTWATKWIGIHPFILTPLDSKGLEFDDVIVGFDCDRKVWNVDSRSTASLRMLRELYVAVTRAQRRVVILVDKKTSEMRNFFESLGYNLESNAPELVLRQEYDKKTTTDTWYKKGQQLFYDGKFKLAAICFRNADKEGWSLWAAGKYKLESGLEKRAAKSFREAARCFFEKGEYEHTLDLFVLIFQIPPWDVQDDKTCRAALQRCRRHLTKDETVRLNLVISNWEFFSVEHLKDLSLKHRFLDYRLFPFMKKIVQESSSEDQAEVKLVSPLLVGDLHFDTGKFESALKIYLECNEYDWANKATKSAIDSTKKNDACLQMLPTMVDLWKSYPRVNREKESSLLIHLFDNPTKAADSDAESYLVLFGRKPIILAVDLACLDRSNLYFFSQTHFTVEVTKALESKCEKLEDVASWFVDKGDMLNASEFVRKRLKRWSQDELCNLVELLKILYSWLFEELAKRMILFKCTQKILNSDRLKNTDKDSFLKSYTSFDSDGKLTGKKILAVVLMCFEQKHLADQAFPTGCCFVRARLETWRRDELFQIVQGMKDLPRWLYDELVRRKVLLDVMIQVIKSKATKKSTISTLLRAYAGYDQKGYFRGRSLMELLVHLFYAKDRQNFLFLVRKYSRNWSDRDLTLVSGIVQQKRRKDFLLWYSEADTHCDQAVHITQYSLQHGLRGMALQNSVRALQTRELAEANVVEILNIWECYNWRAPKPRKGDLAAELPGNPTVWLTLLCANPGVLWRSEDLSILIAFGPSVLAFAKMQSKANGRYSRGILTSFVKFHSELEAAVAKRQIDEADQCS